MNCPYCATNFCWLCNAKIYSNDAYTHFKTTSKSSCVGLLFEGSNESEEDFLDEMYENYIDDEFYEFENLNLLI